MSAPRVIEAKLLCDVLLAARNNTLDAKRAAQDRELGEWHEVVP